ncbi:MAG: YkgJ family cysteine cluster protein [Lentisphaeria bacterium]|nr:YkgJ family cysteine cluster protein [Lentisphaeria bacterium]NQZ70793.1 YkgJ family cysteine cluster protein [Lentisphaeria bacterium]
MKDGPIRKTIKAVVRWRHKIDLTISRFFQGKPEFVLKGECNGCGACCKNPTIQVFPPLFYFKSIRWCMIKWHKHINGFEYIDANRKEKYLIFTCSHLDSETMQCDSYSSRPGICRDYPYKLLYSPTPEFLEECSYYAEYENAESLNEALDELDLPEDKIQEIKEKLKSDKK